MEQLWGVVEDVPGSWFHSLELGSCLSAYLLLSLEATDVRYIKKTTSVLRWINRNPSM
jgi:hypothetical protein